MHYLTCLASGRLEVWRKAAISAIDLLASVPDVKIVHRGELEALLEVEAAQPQVRGETRIHREAVHGLPDGGKPSRTNGQLAGDQK